MSEHSKAVSPHLSQPTWNEPSLVAARPDADPSVAHPFSPKNVKDKKLNRSVLCRALGWKDDGRAIVFAPLALTDASGLALFEALRPAFASARVHVLAMGEIAASTGPVVTRAMDEQLFHQALAAADMLLLPGALQPAFLPQALAWRYAAVPLLGREQSLNGEADNYDPVLESGNSFLFADGDVWSAHAALVRALETYRLPYDWRGIQRNALELGWA